MLRRIALVAVLAAFGSVAANGQQPAAVDIKGQHPQIKMEQVVAGYLSDVNGRYKLRVTEVTFDPGGYVGPHHHVGPGIRCITVGELTFERPDKSTVYRAGDCFFESGDVTHTAKNASEKPVVLLVFELLPTTLSKGSAIPVPK